MAGGNIKVGSRVLLSPKAKHNQGRTGIVIEPRSAPDEPGGRRWLVRFDWPLGGMGSFAVVGEEELDLLRNVPMTGDTPL